MSRKRLLAVDDQAAILEIVRRAAERLEYDVRVTSSPTEFKTLFRAFAPDVIVVDIVMPVHDGFDMIDFLVAAGCQAHLILMSGHDPLYLKAACALAEARGIALVTPLRKPFDFHQLEEALARFNQAGGRGPQP